jgi:hypothetical protein
MKRYRIRKAGDGFYYPEVELPTTGGYFWDTLTFEGRTIRYLTEKDAVDLIKAETKRKREERIKIELKQKHDFGVVTLEWEEEE